MRKRSRSENPHLARGIVILHEDRAILVVNKPAGLLTVGTEMGKSLTAYSILTNYVRKGSDRSRNRVFIVHRLDRDTSGVLIFAKNEAAQHRLQSEWNETRKKYLAIVHGKCRKQADTISTYLAENRAQVVYSTSDPAQGKLSHTAYQVLRQTKCFTLVEVSLLTGRKNQIRVHLAGIGHPIVGDRKYGRTDDAHANMALHARSIVFKHPTSGKELTFIAEAPAYFSKLVGSLDREDSSQNSASRPPQ
jgi:tRNA pseudouridine32 synthase/23S rRNA pseudouridine746 synthase/23S rRNA pseudouridine1911/1915/1917 synthase